MLTHLDNSQEALNLLYNHNMVSDVDVSSFFDKATHSAHMASIAAKCKELADREKKVTDLKLKP